MKGRYVSWLMVPGALLALLGALTFLAALAGDARSTDVPLAPLVVGLVLVVFGAAWQAELRRRD